MAKRQGLDVAIAAASAIAYLLAPQQARRMRRIGYDAVRIMGNVAPFAELNPRKIVRRVVHRKIGRMFGDELFGKGLVARLLKGIFGR